jgi:UDP-D-galactose:(glucosyl)LPS alpha-1,6-D-galactosyltransferase
MKIYFVLEHVGGKGGVETVVAKVTQLFSSDGHDVHVFLPSPSTDDSWEKSLPNVHYYHKEKLKIFNRLQFISERAIGLSTTLGGMSKPDIVIATHVPQTVFYSRAAVGMFGSPPIVSWLHNPPSRFGEPHFINYADLHLAISRGIEQEIEGILSRNSPVSYIGNPFDIMVEKISPVIGSHFLYIGRLENKQKRLDILFHALSQLSIPWTLDIYGSGPDEESLKNLALQLKISEKVIFHGWVDNPWNEIHKVTSLVLTSDFEGMPMVIGEAMARGIPVLSTDCETGPSDLIKNNENGWLTPTGNVQQLFKRLFDISSLSQQELDNVSEAAKESIRYFSVQNVINRMKNSFEEIMGCKGEGRL